MKFDEFNNFVPRVIEGEIHEHVYNVDTGLDNGSAWAVRVKGPGKYGKGDYVVEVSSTGVWDKFKKFTHSDFFNDIEKKVRAYPSYMKNVFAPHMLKVVDGEKTPLPITRPDAIVPGISIEAFMTAINALAVCEYRRYPQGDPKGGGRYLPINFILAIMGGYWDTHEATKLMRVGRPALYKIKGFKPYTPDQDAEEYCSEIL